MTPEQALEILSNATQPQAAGRLDRAAYCAVEQAILVLREAIKKEESKNECDD